MPFKIKRNNVCHTGSKYGGLYCERDKLLRFLTEDGRRKTEENTYSKYFSVFGLRSSVPFLDSTIYPVFSIIIICLFLIGKTTFSQVVINEFSCANLSSTADNYGQYEDWIELYNTSASAVDLTGYYLSDKLTNPTKWVFPVVTIPANGRLRIYASGRDEYISGNLHTNFKLTQTDLEYVVLANPSGTVIDSYWIQIPNQNGHSTGRTSDGGFVWGVCLNPTPGVANSNSNKSYALTPVFSIAPGYYASAINLTLSSPQAGTTIYYTLNGNEPTSSSTTYTGAIAISATTVVRAIAYNTDPNIVPSFTETNTYFIGDSHTVPVISVSGSQVDNLLNGSYIEPQGSFEYFSSSQVLIDEATGFFNKHGNDSWAYDQRGFDYVCKDQLGYNYSIQDKIFRTKTRNKFQRLIFKPAANDNYPFEDGAHIRDAYVHTLSQIGKLKLDERSYEPCILYVNGQYWGVYEIREKVDDADFTDYYYSQSEENLQYLKTWGGTWSEYGGAQAQTDWNNLKNFILTNDMTNAANFNYVDSLYNWQSLVDYVVLNSYVVCSDWLNWNTSWWRGMNPNGDKKKWRYALWDMDATFGHYINYTGIPSQNPDADPCNPETLDDPGGQGHIPILNKLMTNATFKQYYVSRYIDLSNTVFSCDFMQAHLDSLIGIIQPEMQDQVNRWGGTYNGWLGYVQELKDFIDSRCANFSGGMIDCYNLSGPYPLTILVDPPLSGDVSINSLNLNSYPWTGNYYGGVDILLSANANAGFLFSYWELNNHTVSPDSLTIDVILSLTSADTLIAHFGGGIELELGNDTILCTGDTLILNAGNSTMVHTWQNGFTDSTFVVTQSGTYFVRVDNECCSVSDTIRITFLAPPVFQFGNDTTLCDNATLLLNAGNTGSDFLWNNSATNQTLTVTQQGSYSVTVSNICGSAIDGIVVNYAPYPVLNLGEDWLICVGDTVLLDAGNPGCTYHWNDDYDQRVYPASVAGNYSVTVDNGFGCTSTDVVIITTIPSLNVNAGTDKNICPGQSVQLHGSGGTFYSWWPTEGLSDPDIADPIASPDTTTQYFLTASTITGCSYTDSLTIKVFNKPVFEIFKNQEKVCPGDPVSISVSIVSGTLGPYSYLNELGQMVSLPITTSLEEPDYYTLTVMDLCNSKVTDSIFIDLYETPEVFFTPNKSSGCEPLMVVFSDNIMEPDIQYLWNFGDGGSVSTLQNPEHKYDDPGKYDVGLTIINSSGCHRTVINPQLITVFEAPVAAFQPVPDRTSIVDPVIQFQNNSIGDRTRVWSFGNGTQDIISEPECAYKETGEYAIKLSITADNGCTAEASGTVIIEPEYTFYAPTAFCPEGQIPENLYFRVFSNGVDTRHFHLIIYDRWEEKVFETYSYDHGWDGKIKGRNMAPTGVYTWKLSYSELSGKAREEQGTVTLIR